MTASIGDKDYNVGRVGHRIVVDNGDWYGDDDHNDDTNDINCYDDKNQQWQRQWQTTINKEQRERRRWR